MIFETQRLTILSLKHRDKDVFTELLTDPRIIDSVGEQVVDYDKILRRFEINLNSNGIPKKHFENIWAVYTKESDEMIGIGAFLTNDEDDWEMGYRFLVNSWGFGFGTELAKGMIDFFFEKLTYDKLTADVDVENLASVKILQKMMTLKKEFYNNEDKCWDRRYELYRKDWHK